MAANPATYVDVESRWRTLTTAEQTVATTLLGDAWAIIKSKDSTIDTRLDATTLDSALVVMVLANMVKRVLMNPEGYRQESIQDYSRTTDLSGQLEVLDSELDLLASSDTLASDAFTIRPAYKIPIDSSTYVAADWEYGP